MTDVNPKARLLKKSRIQIYGLHMSSCGYCKRKKESSCSYGVVAASLAADDYLRMMMIGWRRSGTYLYKPAMHVTCCPQYTIRLEVSRFIINKSQRQVLRRVQRYLDTGTVLAESSGPQSGGQSRPAAKDAGDSKPSQSSAVHNLTVELVPAENTEERYELYRKYQVCGRLVI
jgi:arginine-tRNA-protein transferase